MTTAGRMFYADAFLTWHDWARALGFALLAWGLAYAVVQLMSARARPMSAGWFTGGSLRGGLVVGLVLVATVPTAALGLFLAERSAHLRHDRIAVRLEEAVVATAASVDQFLDKHQAAVTSAANSVGGDGRVGRDELTRWLLVYHDVYRDFLTMLSADADGRIVTATSNVAGLLAPIAELRGFNVSDRDYFRSPMAGGGTFVSEVFQGRDLGRDPIVAISAPVLTTGGERVGIVEGSLNLRAFRRIDSSRARMDGSVMILVDQRKRVIYASPDAGLAELEPIASRPLVQAAVEGNGAASFDFALIDSGGDRHHYLGARQQTRNGWTVYLKAPLDQVAQQMVVDYQVSGVLVLLALLLSLLLAASLVRRVSVTVDDMNAALQGLTLDGEGETFRTPANTPSEFTVFFEQMQHRSAALLNTRDRLQNSIDAGERLRSELSQALANKDIEIAEQTAELEAANERLLSLTKRDPLTGIPNRREFDDFSRRVWRQALRDDGSAAVIMADIDFFKVYNDTVGHQCGDDCLRKVAKVLQECAARPMDLVARYGGEEFVAVLGGATLGDALIVAARMREAVADLQMPHPGAAFGMVTVSLGVAAATAGTGADLESVVKAADDALYYAKAAGRNCVVFSDEGEFVTYGDGAEDLTKTNVLSIMTGRPLARMGDGESSPPDGRRPGSRGPK